VTFISDISIGYWVRPRVDIGYRHFPKFTHRYDTNSRTSLLIFCRPDALPAAQPTASKHWRH